MTALFTALKFANSPFGRIVGVILLAAIYTGIIFAKGDFHGAARVQAKWDAALQREASNNAKAREQSEAEQPHLEPAPSPKPDKSCIPDFPRARNDGVLVNDPFNRNRRRK